jgi:hypothetical protein
MVLLAGDTNAALVANTIPEQGGYAHDYTALYRQ